MGDGSSTHSVLASVPESSLPAPPLSPILTQHSCLLDRGCCADWGTPTTGFLWSRRLVRRRMAADWGSGGTAPVAQGSPLRTSRRNPECGDCDEPEVVAQCITCGLNYCEVCFKAHKVKRDTRDHDIRKIRGERSPEFRRDADATSRNDGGSQ